MKKGNVIILLLVVVIVTSTFWTIVLKVAKTSSFAEGERIGRIKGQESVKGQLLPPVAGRLYEVVPVGKEFGSEKPEFYMLEGKMNFRELIFIKPDGTIVRLEQLEQK
jgi:hypothetical protein